MTKSWEKTKYPSIGEWIKKKQKLVVYLYNEIPVRNKRNKLLIQATRLMNLKNSMLSKRSQSQKVHSVILFI